MELMTISEVDPKVIAAGIGAAAVLVSAIMSYFISNRVEQRNGSLEYLRRKISILEDTKKELLTVSRTKTSGKVTSKNLAQKAATALEQQYDTSVKAFLATNHYLPIIPTESLKMRIAHMNGSIAKARGEHLLGKQIENMEIGEPLEGSDAVSEMLDIAKEIRILIEEELCTAVQNMEKISGLIR